MPIFADKYSLSTELDRLVFKAFVNYNHDTLYVTNRQDGGSVTEFDQSTGTCTRMVPRSCIRLSFITLRRSRKPQGVCIQPAPAKGDLPQAACQVFYLELASAF